MKKSIIYGVSFVVVIFFFAFSYWILPADSWLNNGVDNFLDALYYSIITISTLGFGDICPSGFLARMITCIEVILGVIIVGLFLNEIAKEQADKVNMDSEHRQKKQHADIAKIKIVRQLTTIIPILRMYLTECYEVVTPIDKRKFPEDVFVHKFEWTFQDMRDLFANSMLLINPINSNAIDCYFPIQHKLLDELKSLNSNTELQYYPELQEQVYIFINECSHFLFEPSILSAKRTTLGTGESKRNFTTFIYKEIKDFEGKVEFKDGNIMNAYIALYHLLKILIPTSQQIAQIMMDIIKDPLAKEDNEARVPQ